jgi:hypothetical protein
MGSILNLCSSAILLNNGSIINQGKTSQIITHYLSETLVQRIFQKEIIPEKTIQLTNAKILESNLQDDLLIEMKIHSTVKSRCSIDIRVNDCYNNPLGFASLGAINLNEMLDLLPGNNVFLTSLSIKDMAIGNYIINIDITEPNIEYYDRNEGCLNFEVIKNTDGLTRRHLSQQWNYGSYNIPFKLIVPNV